MLHFIYEYFSQCIFWSYGVLDKERRWRIKTKIILSITIKNSLKLLGTWQHYNVREVTEDGSALVPCLSCGVLDKEKRERLKAEKRSWLIIWWYKIIKH
jgi:hypothetical protein